MQPVAAPAEQPYQDSKARYAFFFLIVDEEIGPGARGQKQNK